MRTLLLVDDFPLLRDAVGEMLALAGISVRAAADAASAIVAYKSAPPDIVLIDIQMPDGDGLSLCSRLRQLARQCGHPFRAVLMTGYSTPELEAAAQAAGAAAVIAKPFSTHQLLQALERATERLRHPGHAA
jgi:CheY-like chemotaxis protein